MIGSFTTDNDPKTFMDMSKFVATVGGGIIRTLLGVLGGIVISISFNTDILEFEKIPKNSIERKERTVNKIFIQEIV